MKTLKLIALATAVCVLPGCATILSGDSSTINLATSNGKKTTVAIDGQEYMAPGVVVIPKSQEDKIIVANSDTCKGQTAMKAEVEPTFWVNVISGGAFGSTTDYSTNSMWTYGETVIVNCGS